MTSAVSHAHTLGLYSVCVSEDEQLLSAAKVTGARRLQRGMRSDSRWLTNAAVAREMRAAKWSGRVVPLNPVSPLRRRLTALNWPLAPRQKVLTILFFFF